MNLLRPGDMVQFSDHFAPPVLVAFRRRTVQYSRSVHQTAIHRRPRRNLVVFAPNTHKTLIDNLVKIPENLHESCPDFRQLKSFYSVTCSVIMSYWVEFFGHSMRALGNLKEANMDRQCDPLNAATQARKCRKRRPGRLSPAVERRRQLFPSERQCAYGRAHTRNQ